MAAPTFVNEGETVWNTNVTPKTASLTLSLNDVVVACSIAEDAAANTLPTPNHTDSLANTWTTRGGDNTGSHVEIVSDTMVAAAGKTGADTISATNTAASPGNWGSNALQFSGSNGVGATPAAVLGTGTAQMSITTTQDNSAVVVFIGDWAAVATAHSWLTVNGVAAVEKTYLNVGTSYTVYGAYWPDVGPAGPKTVGLVTNSPAGMTYSIIAVEVKGILDSGGTWNFAPPWGKGPGRRNYFWQPADVSGGQTFTQAVSATLGLTGNLAKQAGVSRLASLTLTGARTIGVNASRLASLAWTGTVGRGISATRTASLALSGTLAAAKTKVLAVTATLGLSGSATKRAGVTQSTTAGLSGTVTKGVGAIRATTASLSGALVKAVSVTRLATLALSASLTARRVFLLTLSATLGLGGSVGRTVGHGASATLGLGATATRAVRKTTATTLGLAGSRTVGVSKTVAATLTHLASVAAVSTHTFFVTVTASLNLSGSLTRRTAAVRLATLSATASAVKAVRTTTVGSLALSASVTTGRLLKRTLTATLNLSGSVSGVLASSLRRLGATVRGVRGHWPTGGPGGGWRIRKSKKRWETGGATDRWETDDDPTDRWET